MDSDHHRNTYLDLSSGSSKGHMIHVHHDELNYLASDAIEDDMLNDETFGDCDIETIKKKSDFGPNGEFLGENPTGNLPSFFDHDEQSQQPSIDALLGEDSMRIASVSMHRRPAAPLIQRSSNNPLFPMAASQAVESQRPYPYFQQSNNARLPPMNLPPPQPPPQPQPQQQQQQLQINYQLLKQFEQLLISKQIPPQERLIYIKAMMEKMQREAINNNNQQQTTRHFNNYNNSHHDLYRDSSSSRVLNNPLSYHQRQQQQQQQQQQLRESSMRSMAIGEMMERARLAAAPIHGSRSQSPNMIQSGSISSQLIDGTQDIQHKTGMTESPSSPIETAMSPTSKGTRHNRSSKFYPRPPMLNTWQGRGSGHDEFSGLMTDREKQWVVKIQLHQVSQTEDEDYYFHKWSQQKRHMQQVHGNQSARGDQRSQYISYPVLQLLKSIQQEKEMTQRLSQSTTPTPTISNLNPAQAIPYASPLATQLGKQSIATPRHPKCILHLDGQFTLGISANAITHDKYELGLLLNIENIYRDILRLDNDDDEERSNGQIKTGNETKTIDVDDTTATSDHSQASSSVILASIIDRYLNHSQYLFADMFAQFKKGQILLERLYPYLITTTSTSNHLELMLIRLYGSLNYMIRSWPNTYHIEPIVMNMISLMQQQVNIKKTTFEQLLSQVYIYYDQEIKPKLLKYNSNVSSSPFSDPILFTNSHTITIVIELLLTLERRCYLFPGMNSSSLLPVQLMQQLQPQLQYQLSEHVRLLVSDLCQALVMCSAPMYTSKKMLKPFAQVQQHQFVLLCKFLRIQISPQIYAALEPKLIACCIKDM